MTTPPHPNAAIGAVMPPGTMIFQDGVGLIKYDVEDMHAYAAQCTQKFEVKLAAAEKRVAELEKENDDLSDTLNLRCFQPVGQQYTGESMTVKVTSILRCGHGCHVLMAFAQPMESPYSRDFAHRTFMLFIAEALES